MRALVATIALAQKGGQYSCDPKSLDPTRIQQLVPFPPADPYKGEALIMEELRDMRKEHTHRDGNRMLMRGTFRGQECVMKVVDVSKDGLYDELVNEIEVYKHLEEVQGSLVPKFLGHGNLSGTMEVLILEDCRYAPEWTEWSTGEIVRLLEQIHAFGVLRGDPTWANVVRCPSGEFVLVDFGRSKISNFSEKGKGDEIELARIDMWY